MTMLTIATTVAVYAAYVAVVRDNGYFSILWQGKTAGIQRMLGLVQTTGFNSGSGSGGIPLQPPVAEASYFGTTYTMLMLAAPAVLVVLFRGDQLQRMLGLLYCAAGVTLAYAVFLGTLEEQELYLLVVPSLVIIPVAATLLLERKPARAHRSQPRSRPRKLGIAAMGAALTIALGVNLLTCVRWLLQPDDGFAQLISYVTDTCPGWHRDRGVYGDIETHMRYPDTRSATGKRRLLSPRSMCATSWWSGLPSTRATQTRHRPRSKGPSATTGWCSRSQDVPMATSCCTSFRAVEDSSGARSAAPRQVAELFGARLPERQPPVVGATAQERPTKSKSAVRWLRRRLSL